jgi:hypothetical protein
MPSWSRSTAPATVSRGRTSSGRSGADGVSREEIEAAADRFGGGEGGRRLGSRRPDASAAEEPAADEIQLVVRGDDLGVAQGVNAAAIEAYEHGIVRSVEVIVPGPWFLDAVERLKKSPTSTSACTSRSRANGSAASGAR